nr:hypothetical protein PSV3_00177 [Pseudomonas phage PSV3]
MADFQRVERVDVAAATATAAGRHRYVVFDGEGSSDRGGSCGGAGFGVLIHFVDSFLGCAGCDFARFVGHCRVDFHHTGFDKRAMYGRRSIQTIRPGCNNFGKADNRGGGVLLRGRFLGSHFAGHVR